MVYTFSYGGNQMAIMIISSNYIGFRTSRKLLSDIICTSVIP
jgi:hypothetical protein